MDSFFVTYSILEIFGTYTIYRMMKVFHEKNAKNKNAELVSYIGYYLFGIIIYLVVEIPIVNLIFNVGALFLITFNYKSSFKRRIFSALLIYMMIICTETIILLLIHYTYPSLLEQNNYTSLSAHISNKVLLYVIMVLMSKSKGIKNGEIMPPMYWVCLIAVPGFTLYVVYTLPLGHLTEMQIIIIFCSVFIINYAVFYLYDSIALQTEEKAQKVLVLQENASYLRQFELIKESKFSMLIIGHDYDNHVNVLKELAEIDKTQEAMQYIDEMMNIKDSEIDYIESGNLGIDSILNVKIHEAKQNGIEVVWKVTIPMDMDVDSYDMTFIFGNLLDIVIEATKASKQDEKSISIRLWFDRDRLFTSIKHTVHFGTENNHKNNSEIREYKLRFESIQIAMKKYYGRMEWDIKSGESEINILMITPLDEIEE